MENRAPETADQTQFYVSKNSPAGQATHSILIGLVVATALIFWKDGFTKGALLSWLFIAALLYVVYLYVRRKVGKAGQTWVTLTSSAIESHGFSSKARRYAWSEIDDAAIQVTQGVTVLQLQLKSLPDRQDKRTFLTGSNPARPTLALTPLDPADQEALMTAIARRIHREDSVHRTEVDKAAHALKEERLFQERLVEMMPQTWATYLLIGLNVLVWLVTVALGASVLQAHSEQLFSFGGNVASEVQRGQWWRLLTATFLHAGLIHLAMNMLGLYIVGMPVERIYGRSQFLLIYFGSALVGSASSLHFSAQHAVSVGASGAVFGVAGALFVAMYLSKKDRPQVFSKQTVSSLGFFVLYSLFQGFSKSGIDNAAHVGGLFAGVTLAVVLPTRFKIESYRRAVSLRLPIGIAIASIATIVGAMTAPPATVDIRANFLANAAFHRGAAAFQSEIKLLEQEALDMKSGKITEIEADERSRKVHAPRWRLIVEELNQAKLPPDDPRAPLTAIVTQMAKLIHESLEMESNIVDGKPVPADPVRSAAIEEEVRQLGLRLAEINKRLQGKTKQP